jgi:hypothetical protein
MATIRTRKQSDGTSRYTAIIRIRKRKTIIYQEYKTFALRTAAVSWAKHRDVELEKRHAKGAAPHQQATQAHEAPYSGRARTSAGVLCESRPACADPDAGDCGFCGRLGASRSGDLSTGVAGQ